MTHPNLEFDEDFDQIELSKVIFLGSVSTDLEGLQISKILIKLKIWASHSTEPPKKTAA